MPSRAKVLHVIRIAQPDLARQAQVLLRLLGHIGTGPNIKQPQDSPGSKPMESTIGIREMSSNREAAGAELPAASQDFKADIKTRRRQPPTTPHR